MNNKAGVKLTPVQLALLQEKSGGFHNEYMPGLRLIELKLINHKMTSYGRVKWKINEAGIAYLDSIEQKG